VDVRASGILKLCARSSGYQAVTKLRELVTCHSTRTRILDDQRVLIAGDVIAVERVFTRRAFAHSGVYVRDYGGQRRGCDEFRRPTRFS